MKIKHRIPKSMEHREANPKRTVCGTKCQQQNKANKNLKLLSHDEP